MVERKYKLSVFFLVIGGSACYPPTNLGTSTPVVSPAIQARKELGVSLISINVFLENARLID